MYIQPTNTTYTFCEGQLHATVASSNEVPVQPRSARANPAGRSPAWPVQPCSAQLGPARPSPAQPSLAQTLTFNTFRRTG